MMYVGNIICPIDISLNVRTSIFCKKDPLKLKQNYPRFPFFFFQWVCFSVTQREHNHIKHMMARAYIADKKRMQFPAFLTSFDQAHGI